MNYRLVLILVLVASLPASSQSLQPGNDSRGTYSVMGTVQNSVTGDPIPHALVQMMGRSQQNTFTDAGGRFEFEHVPGGMASFLVRKPGFFNQSEIGDESLKSISSAPSARYPGNSGAFTVGPETGPVILRLVPEGVIYGRALRPDGEPIANLTVQLFYFRVAEGRKRWDLMNNTQTNDDGEFRVSGLRPGRYYVQAGPRFQPTFIGTPGQPAREAAYVPVFYPGVRDLASSAPIDLSAGQQFEASFSLTPEPVFRISGRLSGVPAMAAADQIWPRLTVTSADNSTIAMTTGEAPGNDFHVKAPAGAYVIHADVDTPEGRYRGSVPVTVQSDLLGVNVVVAPAPALRVDVSVQRTHAQPAETSHGVDPVNIRLLSQQPGPQTSEMDLMAGAGGNSINGVEPGIYSVQLTPGSDLYVDSVQSGGTDLLQDDLRVGEQGAAPIRVSLRDDGGTLSGSVTSNGSGSQATVVLRGDRSPKQIKTARAGNDGRFTFASVPPGDYSLFAFDSVEGLEYTNPEVMNAYSSSATRVNVAANSQTSVPLNIIQLGR